MFLESHSHLALLSQVIKTRTNYRARLYITWYHQKYYTQHWLSNTLGLSSSASFEYPVCFVGSAYVARFYHNPLS